MRAIAALFVLVLSISILWADNQPLPDLFRRAKEKFAAGDYRGSLSDFELLDANSAKAGFENDRGKLLPVVTFYRGANLAALGKTSEAKETFSIYLGLVPTASISSPPFPKSTVDLFEKARNEAGSVSKTMANAYAAYVRPLNWSWPPDERWIETPVRYLLTPAQRREYATFTTNAERAVFIEAFWYQLDPSPGTATNEFRSEFERRLAFADQNFATPKMIGRETEQASAFAILGPPTYVAVLRLADDAMSQLRADGNSDDLKSITNVNTNPAPGRSIHNPIYSEIWKADRRKEDNLETKNGRGTREAWYYRSERLPKAVPYKEIRFDFITKEGYGTAVFQKESEPVQAIGIAADAARRDRRLN
jgi:GWxTD domain-containing protein